MFASSHGFREDERNPRDPDLEIRKKEATPGTICFTRVLSVQNETINNNNNNNTHHIYVYIYIERER